MFNFVCKNLLLDKKVLFNGFRKRVLFNGRDSTSTNTNISLCFLKASLLLTTTRSISMSSTSTTTTEISTTVSYLINSCGLSENKALSLCKRIELKTTSQPDSVLTLLRNYGLTNTHISKFVDRRPTLLLADPIKTLKPKLDFLNSIGLCGTDLASVLSNNPTLLTRSLENHIIPSIAFLKTIVETDANLVKLLKRGPWVLDKDLETHLAPKIALLQAHGVPISNISSLLIAQPRSLLESYVDRLDEHVKQVKEMGFDPLKVTFVYAIEALMAMKKSVWEAKLDVYRKWGWSEEDFLTAFMKQPRCMMKSEAKIMHIMDFLVNKMGYGASLIAQHPNVLLLSLENRIIPRCSVLHVLITNGLMSKYDSISTALTTSDEYFLKKYVAKFEEQVPQLLDVYQGKCYSMIAQPCAIMNWILFPMNHVDPVAYDAGIW